MAENKQATSSNEFHRLGISATDHVDFYYAALQEERVESGIKSLTRGLRNESAASTQQTLGDAEC